MRRGRERVLCAAVLLLASACEDKQLSPGFERMGGQANVHFVYLDESVYKGSKWKQMMDSEVLCEITGHKENCDVYIWTDKKKVAITLPLMQRTMEVGWFAMRDGRPAYFKEANQEEPIFDDYGVSNSGLGAARLQYYGGFAEKKAE